MEASEVEAAEGDDVRPDCMAAQPGEDHQRQDVAQLVADVAFPCPSEIGDGGGELEHPVEDAAFGWNPVFLLSLFNAKNLYMWKIMLIFA